MSDMQYRGILRAAAALSVLGLFGCSLSDLVGKGDVPIGTPQPGIIASPEGAIAAYNGTIAEFTRMYGGRSVAGFGAPFIFVAGLISDELSIVPPNATGALALDAYSSLDARVLPQYLRTPAVTSAHATYDGLFRSLQTVRSLAGEAIASLRAYAPGAPRPFMGHAYALQAYTELMLADMFCSGVPLSTLVFEGDIQLRPGSTVNDVYTHAIALFDTALTLSADSARIRDFARIGKGRALVALGRYADAAAAVREVPDGYEYSAQYSQTHSFPNYLNAFFTGADSRATGLPNNMSVANRQGNNGLDFVAARDPRVPTDSVTNGAPRFYPTRFSRLGATPLLLASSIEARLIEAEADLADDNPRWLTRLNALRTTCTDAATCALPAPAGLGGKAGLAPLSDPATKRDQIALLFRERGFWLYLGGQRQGDLRRLVRVYGMDSRSVYPTGEYNGASATFGDDTSAPIPPSEIETNPHVNGCLNRHD